MSQVGRDSQGSWSPAPGLAQVKFSWEDIISHQSWGWVSAEALCLDFQTSVPQSSGQPRVILKLILLQVGSSAEVFQIFLLARFGLVLVWVFLLLLFFVVVLGFFFCLFSVITTDSFYFQCV